MVCRRYWSFNLKAVRKLGTKQGGEWVNGIHFTFAGGQVRSLLSLLSYFGKGENRERYLGVKIPRPTSSRTTSGGRRRSRIGWRTASAAKIIECDCAGRPDAG